MNTLAVKLFRPMAAITRAALGPARYRRLRSRLFPTFSFDEVDLVWRAISKPRARQGVMLDVGAHKGESAELFAESGWTVHCFEPNPVIFPYLEKRLSRRFRNVILNRLAVGEHAEKGRIFYTSQQSSGISSLHAFHESHQPTFTVDIVTLSEYCRANNLNHVDLLKIDAEGFDYFVLRGLDLTVLAPDVIVCEFEDSKTFELGYSYKTTGEYLIGAGYRVIISEWKPVSEYGTSHQWKCFKIFPADLETPDAWGNLIAIKNESTEKLILKELNSVRSDPQSSDEIEAR